MLISSGVVLLFPIFWVLQFVGVQVVSARIISLSYPWIGLPMEMFRANNQSSVPFILSHITRVVIYYSLYEATQLAFSEWFYGQGRPSQRELWLFAIMMLWEYYSMIYVRSNNSIRLFPRASLALFLLYHFYLFSNPSGFHLLALLVLFLFLTSLMIFCVRKFELDAFYRGSINIDQPRMLHNNMPWPSWTVALAPDYTLFMPVTIRTTSGDTDSVPGPVIPVNTTPTPATESNGNTTTSSNNSDSPNTISSDRNHVGSNGIELISTGDPVVSSSTTTHIERSLNMNRNSTAEYKYSDLPDIDGDEEEVNNDKIGSKGMRPAKVSHSALGKNSNTSKGSYDRLLDSDVKDNKNNL